LSFDNRCRRGPCLKILRKIISGGQTGADRAGLDFAIEVGVQQDGAVPSRAHGRIEVRVSRIMARLIHRQEESH
jgi:Circularly permutated YpsA SLOG family